MESGGEWTVDTLKEHYDRVLEERDSRYDSIAKAQKEAIQTAMTASEKAIAAAMASAKEAVLKAESANERRFELLNEFRGTLRDQTATFIPRPEYTARHEALEDKVTTMEARLNLSDGKTSGMNSTWALLAAVVAIILAAVAAVAAFL